MNRHQLSLRTIKIVTVAALVFFGTLAGSPGPSSVGAVGAQLAFSPASANVAVAGTLNVDITVASVTDLGGYDLALQFNPALMHVVSLTDSGFVPNPPSQNIVACPIAAINNISGTATANCTTVFSSVLGPPAPGTGVSTTSATALMHAKFTGVAAGLASLTLTGTTLQGPTGLAIAVTLGSGSITVGVPASVGGVAEQPDLTVLPAAMAPSADHRKTYVLGSIALVIAVGAGGWYMRRKQGAG